MAKTKQIFVCRECGSAQSRWAGKCPDCGAWDSLDAERMDDASRKDPQKGLVEAWATLGNGSGEPGAGPVAAPIGEVGAGEHTPRISTGIGELDRVLGGTTLLGTPTLRAGPPVTTSPQRSSARRMRSTDWRASSR